MLLLDKIIEMGALNEPPPLTAVLRQCILLANDLKAPLLRTWAEQELKGYSNPKDVPEYRVMNVGALGDFAGIGVRYQGRPIPSSLLKPEHRWAAQTHRLTEPVSSYEALDDSKGTLILYILSTDELPSGVFPMRTTSLTARRLQPRQPRAVRRLRCLAFSEKTRAFRIQLILEHLNLVSKNLAALAELALHSHLQSCL